jgi:hypothetical protein
MVVLLNSKDQKSKIKIVELPRCGNDIPYFAFCTLHFDFQPHPYTRAFIPD